MEFYHYLIAIVGGGIAGVINTLAGNGSAITLTILTEVLGLPPNVANGTNRVGICSQSLVGSWVFYKNGKLDLERSWVYGIPTIIGAVFGVLMAVWVSNEQFKQVFSFMLVAMFLVILVKPKRWLRETDLSIKRNYFLIIPAFLAIGFYGGFIQMGMGIFFLAVMVLGARHSMTDANAVKSFVIMAYTIVVIAIFQWKGLIDWKMGALMAVGQTTGGWWAANFASRYEQANLWAYRLLVVIVVVAIIKLFNVHELILSGVLN